MTLYEITSDNLSKIPQTTFDQAGVRERTDLQRLLKRQIDVILPDTLVIAEEFGEWEESKRRIDLLGLDKDANLVVIELKRTEEGGHMELQAIRYAAMVSTMTFERVVDIYGRYLTQNGSSADAREAILSFLGREEPDADSFAQDVRIVLVSANFSKELTTAVMWLNQRDLDIRCIRLIPYNDNGRILIDVQQVIPLPEAAEYQIQLREKEQQVRKDRTVQSHMRKYWESLIALAERKTNLHPNISPSERSWIGFKAGVGGLNYYYVSGQHESRVEIYIDRKDTATNKRIYDELASYRGEIEQAFGDALIWERLDTKQACRISYPVEVGGYRDDESNWPTIHEAMIDAMIRFEKSLSPFVTKLRV
jgi:hypothetical protein